MDTALLSRVGLLLVRPGFLVATAPVFGGVHIPARVRIALAVLLGLALAPVVPSPDRGGPSGLALTVATEAAIGIAMAIGLQVLIAAAELAGHVAGFQIGLTYAAIVDPQNGVRNNVLAVLYGNLAIVTFFGINGHHQLIRALAASYDALPIGSGGLGGSFAGIVAHLLGLVFVTGARLAAPVVTALLIVEILMGLIARAAPSLNLMVVGTPLRLLVGLLALAAGIQVVPGVVAAAAAPALEAGFRLAGAVR
jgi:flagellar biosynthetic protein FliR